MAIIKYGDLATLGIEFRAEFNEGLLHGVPVHYERVATTVPMKTKTVEFGALHPLSGMRKWLGDRQVKKLERSSYSLTAEPYEETIEVDVDDIADDNVGIYRPMFRMLGESARVWPDDLVWEALSNGASGECYDGEAFFSASHEEDGASVSNLDAGGGGDNWYLLDARRAIKPLIWGKREAPRLDSLDKGDDEVVFRRNVAQYGLKARGVPGYGFWQLAYRSNQTLNDTNFNAARTAMMTRTVGGGTASSPSRSFGVMPNLLVVGPSNAAAATALVEMQMVANSAGTAGISNRNYKAVEILVVPQLG